MCEGLPLKNEIFARVSFCKILCFYYKRYGQLFYYEGTSLYIPLKILKRVNRSYFSEFLWAVVSENNPADKNMFKVDNKWMFQECYSGVFIINLENIFEFCDEV